jgi:serine protease AprX
MPPCSKAGGWRKAISVALWTLFLAGSLGIGARGICAAEVSTHKTDRFLADKLASYSVSGWSSVIIRLDGPLTTQQAAQLHALGADIYRHLPIIQSAAVRVPMRNLSRLAGLTFIQHLSADESVHKSDEFAVASSGAGIAFQQYGLTGQGITVAVVDSGIHNGSDLGWLPRQLGGPTQTKGPRQLANISFVPGDTSTDDKCGHGTLVAGILAGDGQSSTGSSFYRTFYGIARQASLANVRVLDGQGQGTVSTVIAGLQWVVNNKAIYNIRVINLSLGHPVGESYTTDPLCQAVEAAWKAGIVVVCAAGNNGRLNATQSGTDNSGWGTAYGSIQSPGNDPYVITVGATKAENSNRANDQIATYSSRGPSRLDLVLKPDIIAPGDQIISLDAGNSYLDNATGSTNAVRHSAYVRNGDSNWSNTYFCLSGTSMAAPVVAGAVAMLLQANPNLSPDTVKARLMISADKWAYPNAAADPCTFGAGYLNIPFALNCPVVATQYALSPTLSQDSSGNVYINEDSSVWGRKALWGTGITDLRVVWGPRALTGSSANILGNSRTIRSSSVWSNRTVWSSTTSAVDLSAIAIHGEK